jgi:hypothetical protein
MATWAQFAGAAPEMAAAGRALWERHGLMFLATVRADLSPRVHPVVPVLVDDRVFVAVPDRSPKWRDLHRERRCVLHGLPGERDDELVLRCRAWEAPHALTGMRAAAGHRIHDDDHLFELSIEQADLGWWAHVGRPETYPVRQRWIAGGAVRHLRVGRTAAAPAVSDPPSS